MKQQGETVAADEPLVELETDKVTVEVNAPSAGVLSSIAVPEGTEVEVGGLLGMVDESAVGTVPVSAPTLADRSAANPRAGVNPPPRPPGPVSRPAASEPAHAPLPAAAKILADNNVSSTDVGAGTGKDGRITKGDVLEFLNRPAPAPTSPLAVKPPRQDEPREQRVKMTRLRRTIALRLKEAQNNAAMLTTFNEVDMGAIMALRTEYRDAFEKKHKGVRLGFMSVFVRACCVALKEFPAVNAEIDGDDVVYKNFVNMGIAVGGPSGLVVPVIRDAETLGFAGIEAAIADFGKRARDGALKLEDLTSGTFSITNGGVYGSLMSTPILNPPQSAILGMHKIQDRAMVVGGKIEIRPMMYLALSYDHRIVDGKEAVSFLVRVKEGVEDPRRLLLDL
jgi:2-oxoglutarate dehydrogenase E2 component (dihydrolipoamide succinyltransferase)